MATTTTSPHQLFSEFSSAQENLAVWLVVVIGNAAGVEFLDYFCAFWELLAIFLFDLKVGGSTCPLTFPSPFLDPPLIKKYFVKLAVWLVVVVGMLWLLGFVFFSCFSSLWELLPYEPEKQYTFAFFDNFIFLNFQDFFFIEIFS